jgi:hypothetical protein
MATPIHLDRRKTGRFRMSRLSAVWPGSPRLLTGLQDWRSDGHSNAAKIARYVSLNLTIVLRQLCGSVFGDGLRAPAAVVAIPVSVSLLMPATPTAPTTSPPTRIGTPPRSAAMFAVMNAVRP